MKRPESFHEKEILDTAQPLATTSTLQEPAILAEASTTVPPPEPDVDAIRSEFRFTHQAEFVDHLNRWTGRDANTVMRGLAACGPSMTGYVHGVQLVRDSKAPVAADGSFMAAFTHGRYLTDDELLRGELDDDLSAIPSFLHVHYFDETFTKPLSLGELHSVVHEFAHVRLRDFRGTTVRELYDQANDALRKAQSVDAEWHGAAVTHLTAIRKLWNFTVRSSEAGLVGRVPTTLTADATEQLATIKQAYLDRVFALLAGDPDTEAADAAIDTFMLRVRRGFIAGPYTLAHFIHYANRYKFEPMTDYARTSDEEWYAETFAQYFLGRDQLREVNEKMFAWMAHQLSHSLQDETFNPVARVYSAALPAV